MIEGLQTIEGYPMVEDGVDLDALVLVAGHGSIGARHVRNLLTLGPGIVVVEPDDGRRAAVPGGLRTYKTVEAALKDERPSHAIVATPASEHESAFSLEIQRVLIEKPLLVWGSDPLGEVRAERFTSHPERFSVGFNLRFLPSLRAFREKVRAAPLGRVLWARVECSSYAPSWRPDRPYAFTPSAWKIQGGGALRECSHEIDLVRWIFGSPTVRTAVVDQTHSLIGDSDDYALAVLRTPYCERVELHLDLVWRDARRRIEVICEGGTVEWELQCNPPVVSTEHRANHDGTTWTTSHYGRARDDIDGTYITEVKALLSDVIPEWADPNMATLEDGLAAVRLVDQIEAVAVK